MKITQKSAKEIVRELYNYEQQLDKKFLGKKLSNDYFSFLKRELAKLTLEEVKPNNYKLALKDLNKQSDILVTNKTANNLFVYFLIEVSNSTELYGFTKSDMLAYNLFNELFSDF